MASNKSLIATAEALAGELGETIVTDGLNNVKLTELVKGLKERKATKASEGITPGEESDPASNDPESNDPESNDPESNDPESNDPESNDPEDETPDDEGPEYTVAEGKSITSMRGIRAEGAIVEARYFPGGQDTLDDLVTRGLVVKS